MDFSRSRNPAFDFGAALANFATGSNREKISNARLASNADAFLKVQKANSFSNGGNLPKGAIKSIADNVFLGMDVTDQDDIERRIKAFRNITGGRNSQQNDPNSPLPAIGDINPQNLPQEVSAEGQGNSFIDKAKQLASDLIGNAGENLSHVPGFVNEQFGKTREIVADAAGDLGSKFSNLDLAQTFRDEGFPEIKTPTTIARELVPLNANNQQVQPQGIFDNFLRSIKALNLNQTIPQPAQRKLGSGVVIANDQEVFQSMPGAVKDENGFFFVPNSQSPSGRQYLTDGNENRVKSSSSK